jgi:hypothetical protein
MVCAAVFWLEAHACGDAACSKETRCATPPRGLRQRPIRYHRSRDGQRISLRTRGKVALVRATANVMELGAMLAETGRKM